MKKYISFTIICLIIIFGLIYFTYGKEILRLLDEKRVYSVKDTQEIDIYTLEEYMFFNDGIITYNNKKIVFLKYNNDVGWENEDAEFAKQVFIADKYIYRKTENNVQVIDKNNQEYVITEIKGDLINVSRENDKTYMILRNESEHNSLYIINDNNDILVENKEFDDKITGVSISDRSEGYSLITMKFDGTINNTVYFNLLDDVELWKTTIENEILVKIQIVNNNVIAIGTNNIYYYNFNGKLMWKNSIFNKILDYEIKKDEQKLFMLFEKDDHNELITYNFEGKVLEINRVTTNARKLKVCGNKIFTYSNNSIYMLHNNKTDKIYEDTENIIVDFIVEGKDITILFNDKIVQGLIK
ncbi:hypothetical protein HZF24_02555 [Sedimentibacter hydroxybenzoicus DSM 7310]|uniref:Uncharacterized protein n=1 Tax=Sedimentibacter hydroxybenzoicus DSM 7310 TaxID=1123245 RepID=A0A974BH10_SEDHY|nr:DUF5711 family protein [Sedimentibacter hydroxybenzoicus]NYB73019.1 hypothetical protein [Sedimentibacter hydroxybenzoicus DSM 7310]